MKKTLKFIVGMLVLSAIVYYGYTTYQNNSSLKGVVHEDAVAVVKIGIHDIKETLILDALGSPRYYYNNINTSNRTEEDNDPEPKDKGVELMPYNLVLFTMPDTDRTLFGVFRVNDSSEFESFITKEIEGKVKSIEEPNDGAYKTTYFKNGHIALAWSDSKLVVALAAKIDTEPIAEVFEEILMEGKTIADTDHPLLNALKKAAAPIAYADGSGFASMEFEDGAAILNGEWEVKSPFPTEMSVPTYKNASLQLHYDFNLRNPDKKSAFAKNLKALSFFEKQGLNTTELAQLLDGRLSFSIAGRTVQNDTVVTYGYDDNFEKVEQKTLQEKEVPAAHLGLGTEESLQDYLVRAGTLSEHGIFEPFPLYQLQLVEENSDAILSTVHDTLVPDQKNSSYFFKLRADFQQLQEDLEIVQTKELFSVLTTMQAQAWQAEDHRIQLEGRINAADDTINILAQLFFELNPKETKVEEPEL